MNCVQFSETKRLLIGAVVSAMLTWLAWPQFSSWQAGDLRSVAGMLATISFTMFGFALASLSVLVAVRHRPLLENMTKTGQFQVLVNTIFASSAALFVAGVMALVSVFAAASEVWWFTGSVFALGMAVVEVAVAGYRFYRTMLFL